jgi:hypothetical protein
MSILDINAPSQQWSVILAEAAREAIFDVVKTKLSSIKERVVIAIRRAINASPAITSMLGGQLQAEFGFIEPATIVRKLLDAIESSIELDLIGGKDIILEIIIDKDKLINSGVGEFRSKNGEVPWLEWLLSSGGRTVIVGFHIEYGAFPKKSRFSGSRSGAAKMVPGGVYAVQKFAGTQERNFITDAIDEQARNEIGEAIKAALI